MFDYLKNTYKIGDAVKIKCSEGSYCGRIVFMSESSLAIEDKNGQKHIVNGNDVVFCEDYKEDNAPSEIVFDEYKQDAYTPKLQETTRPSDNKKETPSERGTTVRQRKWILILSSLLIAGVCYFAGNKMSFADGTNGHEYVDLGLPSGTKWATCNVGASKPTEYGDYFAWGETKPKEEYTLETYKWCKGNPKSYSILKYNTNRLNGTVDNKKVLEAEDDAATANWDSAWRMPTKEEQRELLEGCDWKWVEDFNGSGVNGMLGTSKTNGSTIFLPVAGYRGGTDLSYSGLYGFYWSSSFYEDFPGCAYRLSYFDVGGIKWGYNHRYFGQSVRAVLK